MKILKYIAISIGVILAILSITTAGLWYRLGFKPIHISYFASERPYGVGHTLKIEDVTLQRVKPGTLALSTKIQLSNQDNKSVLEIDDAYITFEVSQLFKTFTMPIQVQLSDLKVNVDNISPGSQLIQCDGATNSLNVFKSLQSAIDFLNNRTSLHIMIKNASIIKNKLVYKVEQNINHHGDLYESVVTITNGKQSGTVSVSSLDSKTKSALTVKINALPVHLFANLLPSKYTPPVAYSANQHLMMYGVMNYALDKELSDNKLDVHLESKDSSNTNDIQKFLFSADNKESPHVFTLKNMELMLAGSQGHFVAKGWITHKQGIVYKESAAKLTFNAQNMTLKVLDRVWPGSLVQGVREWLVSSMKDGIIKDAVVTFSLDRLDNFDKDSFSAHLSFQDLTLKYAEDFEAITAARGEADFNLQGVTIAIKEGKMLSSRVYDSSVEIIYGDPAVPLIIKVLTDGQVRDFMHFMGKDSLQKFHDRNATVQNTKGAIKAQIAIEIPLSKEVTLDNINMDITGYIQGLDTQWTNILRVQEGNMDLKINNQRVSLIGKAMINGKPSGVEWVTALQEDKSFNNRVIINSNIGAGTELDTLFAGKIFVIEGEMLVNFIYAYKNDLEKIVVQLDLKKAKFTVPDIGLSQDKDTKSDFTLELSKAGVDSNWKTNRFYLASNTLNIKSDLELTPNFDLVGLHSHITDDQTDFNVDVTSSVDKVDIKVRGPKVNLNKAPLLNLVNMKAPQLFDTKVKKVVKPTFLSLQIDNAIMKNNVQFNNIIGNFECYKLQCRNSGLALTMNQDEKVKIGLNSTRNENHWTLSATNAALFLKAFDIYNEIEEGTLSGHMYRVKSTKATGGVFIGNMKVDNFYAIKTNLIGSLLLAAPFAPLSSILKTKKLLSFEAIDINFTFLPSDGAFKINKAFAKGNLLSLTAEGDININKDQISIKGILVPRYTINEFANAFSKDDEGKGLFFSPYTISGSISKPSINVNPISGMLQSVLSIFPRLFFNFN